MAMGVEAQLSRLEAIRAAERKSHTRVYSDHGLYEAGSWLAKPVKTVLELLPMLEGRKDFRALDLGSGVGRNSIPVARALGMVDCVDILPMAIDTLRENAVRFGVSDRIRGIVSGIDGFEIGAESYDLILAVSALEHMDSREALIKKLTQIREGLRPGGIFCLVMNTGIREWDPETGEALPPQFEVNLSREDAEELLRKTFRGWEVLRSSLVPQKYDIPREKDAARLETDVLTCAVRKKESC